MVSQNPGCPDPLQNPDGSWNEGTAEKAETYPHKTPMAIIILGTPHRYIPIYQQ
jgi:hypothetical protein